MNELTALLVFAAVFGISVYCSFRIGKLKGNLIQNEHLANLLFKALDNQEIYKEKNILAEELVKKEEELKAKGQFAKRYLKEEEAA